MSEHSGWISSFTYWKLQENSLIKEAISLPTHFRVKYLPMIQIMTLMKANLETFSLVLTNYDGWNSQAVSKEPSSGTSLWIIKPSFFRIFKLWNSGQFLALHQVGLQSSELWKVKGAISIVDSLVSTDALSLRKKTTIWIFRQIFIIYVEVKRQK